jgi:hypothetical protein
MRSRGAGINMTNDQRPTAVSSDAHVAAFVDPEAYAFEAIKLAAGANVRVLAPRSERYSMRD